jgi:uncharacterized protein YndB with AHSA1/START domain
MTAPASMTLERVFAAPRELVFRAWSEPQRFVQWWGPSGFQVEACNLEPRPGGVFQVDMRLPDGQLHRIRGAFTEVEAPSLMAFDGKAITEQDEVMVDGHTRIVFAEEAGGTRLSVAVTVRNLVSAADLRTMKESWGEILERLATNVSETRP